MRQENTSSRLWQMIYPLLTYYGVYYLIFIQAGILGVAFSIVSVEKSGSTLDYYVLLEQTANWMNRHSYEIEIAVNLIVLPLALLYLRMDRNRRGEQRIRVEASSLMSFLPAAVLGIAACLALNGLMNLSGLMRIYEENLAEVGAALYQGRLVTEFLGMVILTPFVEELIFRGLIFRRLKEWISPTAAILCSALIFGIYHGNLLQNCYAAVIGLLLAWLYEKYQHLLAPILAHICANLCSLVASESGVLDEVLAKDVPLIVFSAFSCLFLAGCVYWIQEKVRPSQN